MEMKKIISISVKKRRDNNKKYIAKIMKFHKQFYTSNIK